MLVFLGMIAMRGIEVQQGSIEIVKRYFHRDPILRVIRIGKAIDPVIHPCILVHSRVVYDFIVWRRIVALHIMRIPLFYRECQGRGRHGARLSGRWHRYLPLVTALNPILPPMP